MSDVAYRPADTANPEPAPTETVTLQHLPSWEKAAADAGMERNENWPVPGMTPEEFAREADKPKSEERLLQQMGRDLKAQRERRGEEIGQPPITEIRAPEERESYKDVRELSRETTFNRRLGVANQLTQAGYDDVTAQAIAMRDEDLPPTMAPLATDRGEPIPELGSKLTADDTQFENLYSATRALRNGRAAVEAARLQQEAEWQQQLGQYQQPTEQALPEAEVTVAPQPAQTQQPSEEHRQEAERLAAERFQIAHQAAALQMTQEERGLAAKNAEWDRWLARTPEATSWEAWNFTQQNNPARAAQIIKGFEQCRNAKSAIARRAGELTEIRQNRSAQWNAVQAAAQAKFNEGEDTKFEEALAREMPTVSKGKPRQEMSRYAREELRSYGMSDNDIQREYQSGQLRTAAGQMLLARAAWARMAQERAKGVASNRARVPQPQVPGVWMPAGADHSEDIARLERRLDGQTGLAALRTAKELTQARRRAGLL